ncbi:methyltransferase [Actinosynnema pretiosum]|uniref:Methyltransferase n=1 Tax=Actinosynnema pretiosum subsp. auranticum TaxID=42198 RepID=Q8KUF3_ACTPA|nr:methyltransferase [Actinosynnema pretiosum]AAM54085.1 methyltransferase [Actinosynnema pretiosum subsp. auranticum]
MTLTDDEHTAHRHDEGAAAFQALATAAAGWGALRAAVELRLPDLLPDAPTAVPDLAALAGVAPTRLAQLVAVLADVGVLALDERAHVRHTPLSRALRSTDGLALTRLLTAGWADEAWRGLAEGVRTDTSPLELVHGRPLFDLLAADPAAAAVFHDAVATGPGDPFDEAIRSALDLTGAARVVDVGGGRGRLLAALLREHPVLSGVLFDLPEAVRDAVPELRGDDRVQIRAGDLFADRVGAADVYVLRTVLHVLDDAQAVRALANVRADAPAHARVVVVEALSDDEANRTYAAHSSLRLFVLCGGRERSTAEFAELFDRAGLELRSVTPTGTPYHLLEGAPRLSPRTDG